MADIIAIWEAVLAAINRSNVTWDRSQKIEIRGAIKTLAFSNKSISDLEALGCGKQGTETGHLIADITIRMRDSYTEVRHAIDVLEEFCYSEGISLAGERRLGSILTVKTMIRENIEASLHCAVTEQNYEGISHLAEVAKSLNGSLEEIDNELGGLKL